ncbi:MAG: molybdopterin biosynthesis protein, partial [Candidatus Competibacteraceae bacterium]|nr:molybdopterin biosynthesis protein [Candidatus Competibacteraceae bacterium]
MSASHPAEALRQAARQDQFLSVIDRDEAETRFQSHLTLEPLGTETVSLAQALNRVLAQAVVAEVDVPGFDRANVDGFAIQAADTFGISGEEPLQVRLNPEILAPGVRPALTVKPGTATPIATGGMVPRGADAVIMVEHTELLESTDAATDLLEIRRTVTPGQFISFAGTDVARGETVLRAGQVLTSREIGVLAAIGLAQVMVYRRPRVAIISTGNEIVAPGESLPSGAIYDSNGAIIAAA